MKSYPSILHWNEKRFGDYVYAFDKLDGSNIRFEWSKKRGWYKFGSRRTMIDENHEQLGEAVTIFQNKYADNLEEVFKDPRFRNSRNFVVFAEYVGPNSFAGFHEPDDEMDLVLFDVSQFQKGIVPPKDFIEYFGHLHIPEIVFQGHFDQELVDNVRNNQYNLHEGVIVKGVRKTKGNDITWMTKIKTNAWLERLKKEKGLDFLKEDIGSDSSYGI